jgi:hypothetical protein
VEQVPYSDVFPSGGVSSHVLQESASPLEEARAVREYLTSMKQQYEWHRPICSHHISAPPRFKRRIPLGRLPAFQPLLIEANAAVALWTSHCRRSVCRGSACACGSASKGSAKLLQSTTAFDGVVAFRSSGTFPFIMKAATRFRAFTYSAEPSPKEVCATRISSLSRCVVARVFSNLLGSFGKNMLLCGHSPQEREWPDETGDQPMFYSDVKRSCRVGHLGR